MRHFCVLLFFACVACATTTCADELPNIVIILADDLGYGDVRSNNPDSTIPTPHLDAVARRGMRFTDAHTPSAVCTPTRYGLLTGRYCWRTRLKSGVLNGYSPHLIDEDRTTIADLLKQRGYHTACIGKWHLGMDLPKLTQPDNAIDFAGTIEHGPDARGFDEFFGITASLDFPPYAWIENSRFTTSDVSTITRQPFPSFWRAGELAADFNHEQALDVLTARAEAHIAARASVDQPFFLYMPLTSPHKPTLPAERFRGRSALGPYGDFIIQTDDVIGRIAAALEAAGESDDTLLVVTSDNGSYMYRFEDGRVDHATNPEAHGYRPETHSANGPYRGTKADIYESGHRVFFAAAWPSGIEPGTVCSRTISLIDIFATVAELTESRIEPGTAEDSRSFLGTLRDLDADYRREPIIMHSVAGMFAIRKGDWKLILGNGSGGRQQPRGTPFERPYQLYNLASDPGETTNLIEERPDLAAELEAEFERIRSRHQD